MTERLSFHFSLSCIGKGNGNPLQCSCLENPRDRGAWWASVYGVAQSRTRLTRFSSSRDYTGEGNGTPLQCSCLENPRDRGAWWASVYGVAQSWTRLKRLSSSSHLNLCEMISHCGFDIHFPMTNEVENLFMCHSLILKEIDFPCF